MSALIDNMAYRGKTPWHGLGNTLDGLSILNPDELQEIAARCGFNFTVMESPVIYKAGDMPLVAGDHKLLYNDHNPSQVFGVVSNQFKPVQPIEMLQFFAEFQQETGLEIETAGMLTNGKFWALAKTDRSFRMANGLDETKDYICLASANNGTLATKLWETAIRVECQNTIAASLSMADSVFSVTHRSDVNWNKARDWLTRRQESFSLFANLMQEFQQIPVTTDQAVEFSAELIAPEWKKGEKIPRKLTKFTHTLQSGVGQKEAGRNVYGLLNGVTRYVDHDKQARTTSTRLDSAWFGQGAILKQQAMDMLVKNCVDKWNCADNLVPILRETKYSKLVA